MIFTVEVDMARSALREGWSVRIIGDWGSGRTTVANEIAESLERSGESVLRSVGEHSAGDSPGFVLRRLSTELGLQPYSNDLAGTIDRISHALTPETLLIIDDHDRMDELSRRALATIRDRRQLRTLITETTGTAHSRKFPLRSPEHMIRMRPLDLTMTSALAHEVLGSALDPITVARVVSKTGGSPVLVSSLLLTARNRGLLELRESTWTQSGFSLWNDDMPPVIDEFLDAAGPDVRDLLRGLAEDQDLSPTDVELRYGDRILQRARALGLVRPANATGTPRLVLWPPIIAERYNRSRVPNLVVGTPAPGAPAWCGDRDALASLARRFTDSALDQAGRALTSWLQEPSAEHALAYYQTASGDPRQEADLHRVLMSTPVDESAADSHSFLLVFARAQWSALHDHDPARGIELLTEYGRAHPRWAQSGASAAVLLSVMSGHGVCDDISALYSPGEDPTGIRHSALLITLLASGRIDQAREFADSHTEQRRSSHWARQVLPLFEGDARSSLRQAAEALDSAEHSLDRTLFTSSAYTAAMCHHYLGQFRAVQQCVDAAVLVGRPQLDYTPVYTAALNIQGLISVFSGQSGTDNAFLSEAATLMPQPGPFLAMGSDSFRTFIDLPRPGPAYDHSVAQMVSRRIELGYVTAAVQTAAGLLSLSYGTQTASALRTALQRGPVPAFRAVGELTELIDNSAAPDRIAEYLRELGPGQHDNLLQRVLIAAAGSARAANDHSRSEDLERLSRACFDQTSLPDTELPTIVGSASTDPLTSRELEIALLAGTRTNREIASRLNLSVRTVENHLARAFRKTGAGSRSELFNIAEGLPSH